jgi:hypothetical protein
MHTIRTLLIAGFVLWAFPALAQTAPTPAPTATTAATPNALSASKEEAARLALIKESQNPIGNMAIIPFQSNWNYGYGPYDRTQYVLDVEPVVPIELSPKFNLIARSIVPLLNQPSPLPPTACASPGGCPWTFGISNVQEQLYLAPRVKPGGLIWGAGPIFYLPTANPGGLGSPKTSVGPTAVALIMPGQYVIGLLVNQAWSVMGPSSAPPVSSFVAQPFINDNLGKGWAIVTAPIITANWNAPGDNKWTVPAGLGVDKIFKIGDQLEQIQIAYYANIVRPVNSPNGTWRFQWSLLYPVKRR